MADRVLPALVGSSEERELLLEELVDLGQSELLAGDGLDGHHDEGDVAVGRLLLPPHPCTQDCYREQRREMEMVFSHLSRYLNNLPASTTQLKLEPNLLL